LPPTTPLRWPVLGDSRRKSLGMGLGLVLILAANLFLRAELEATPLPYYPVFPGNHVPLGWNLLLPVDLAQAREDPNQPSIYHWFTTGLTVIKLLEEYFPISHVFYFLNAALIVCTFMCSWLMFRSVVFSFTMTFCMAFGTQFHWLYDCSPVETFYLFVIYLELNILCVHKAVETGRRSWYAAFIASLMVLAMCHEQWLDYFAFLTLGAAIVLAYARRTGRRELYPRIGFLLTAAWIAAVLYLGIRLSYGEQQYRAGNESEMVFTYPRRVLAVEDVISNGMTYLYLAISNYFPPFMVSSNSLYRLGAEQIVAEQHGYHEAKTQLAAMHHLYYWYFWAGIVFAVFAYFLMRTARATFRDGSGRHLYFFLAMVLIVCGFAVHALVKFRPYLSVPLLTYKCMTSNVGVTFLLAGCVMCARDWMPRWKRLHPVFVPLVWGVILYGGLTRPAYLSHLSHEVGMGSLPDPWRALKLRWSHPTTVAAPPDVLHDVVTPTTLNPQDGP
jgi:hypothetical protein